jgi:hypothetical protein
LQIIDLMHVGVPRVIGCWQVGDVLIDPGPSTGLPALLEALGDDYRPRRRQRHARAALAGGRGVRSRARSAAHDRPVAPDRLSNPVVRR